MAVPDAQTCLNDELATVHSWDTWIPCERFRVRIQAEIVTGLMTEPYPSLDPYLREDCIEPVYSVRA